ncbi:MAG: hypothetical protein ACK4K7_09040 [Allosphingosinicella sp.]|uniref:hypothetical protein n=1 Tax=Allosphingosinicella sp. TaxID=2823234 RepID=UPI00395C6791
MAGADPIRDALAALALAEIPRLLTLQDRTPVSATYGSFDRAWWHYRVMDFPSGMAQKLVLPLALAWQLDLPGNRWKGDPEVRGWVEAGIRFAARSAHGDGSCDDYYPFERASGAAAFALLACLDAAEIIGLADPEVDDFLKRRADWLARHEESGRLANHEALIVACLARMAERFGEAWETPLRRRAERLLSWQSGEGWFDEYGGADPGYLTLTVAQLADVDRRRPDLGLREPCRAAIRFLHAVQHPDGTLGGEYASRATVNFFPHGLEIAGAWEPLALAINDRALPRLARAEQAAVSDDRLFGHHLAAWMLAWREWREERPGPAPLPEGQARFDEAKLLVDGRGATRLYLGWGRGGAFRLFEGERLRLADTGIALRTRSGRVAVTHLDGAARIAADRIEMDGQMAWAKSARLTPLKSVVLRLLMLTLGRFFPDLVRRLLQRLLVTGRDDAPFRFRRILDWRDGGWTVRDEILPERGWDDVDQAGIGGFQSSLTTVMARVWEPAHAQPWTDLTDRVRTLGAREPLIVERRP